MRSKLFFSIILHFMFNANSALGDSTGFDKSDIEFGTNNIKGDYIVLTPEDEKFCSGNFKSNTINQSNLGLCNLILSSQGNNGKRLVKACIKLNGSFTHGCLTAVYNNGKMEVAKIEDCYSDFHPGALGFLAVKSEKVVGFKGCLDPAGATRTAESQ